MFAIINNNTNNGEKIVIKISMITACSIFVANYSQQHKQWRKHEEDVETQRRQKPNYTYHLFLQNTSYQLPATKTQQQNKKYPTAISRQRRQCSLLNKCNTSRSKKSGHPFEKCKQTAITKRKESPASQQPFHSAFTHKPTNKFTST